MGINYTNVAPSILYILTVPIELEDQNTESNYSIYHSFFKDGDNNNLLVWLQNKFRISFQLAKLD